MRRFGVVGVMVGVFSLAGAGSALAAQVNLCVPVSAGPVTSRLSGSSWNFVGDPHGLTVTR